MPPTRPVPCPIVLLLSQALIVTIGVTAVWAQAPTMQADGKTVDTASPDVEAFLDVEIGRREGPPNRDGWNFQVKEAAMELTCRSGRHIRMALVHGQVWTSWRWPLAHIRVTWGEGGWGSPSGFLDSRKSPGTDPKQWADVFLVAYQGHPYVILDDSFYTLVPRRDRSANGNPPMVTVKGNTGRFPLDLRLCASSPHVVPLIARQFGQTGGTLNAEGFEKVFRERLAKTARGLTTGNALEDAIAKVKREGKVCQHCRGTRTVVVTDSSPQTSIGPDGQRATSLVVTAKRKACSVCYGIGKKGADDAPSLSRLLLLTELKLCAEQGIEAVLRSRQYWSEKSGNREVAAMYAVAIEDLAGRLPEPNTAVEQEFRAFAENTVHLPPEKARAVADLALRLRQRFPVVVADRDDLSATALQLLFRKTVESEVGPDRARAFLDPRRQTPQAASAKPKAPAASPSEEERQRWMKLAELHLANGKADSARVYLNKVINSPGKSELTARARQLLKDLR